MFRRADRVISDSPTLRGLMTRIGLAEMPSEFKPWQRTRGPEVVRAWEVTEALLIRLHEEVTDAGSHFLVVAAAGGWTNSNTLRQVYQQADQETMLRVVLDGGTLREAR